MLAGLVGALLIVLAVVAAERYAELLRPRASLPSPLPLELRARQLRRPAERLALAVRVAGLVERPGGADAAAVAGASADLLALAFTLNDPTATSARGVALTRRLLDDGLSPLYAPTSPEALRAGVREIRVQFASVVTR